MKMIQNGRDFDHLRMEGDIDTAVLSYIEDYFHQFAVQTEEGLSIQDVGMIVILEEGDRDMFCSELLLPSVFRSVPEETKLIPIQTSAGNIIEVFQSLFLPNNEMGIDLFCVKGGVSKEIQDRLMGELEGKGGVHRG